MIPLPEKNPGLLNGDPNVEYSVLPNWIFIASHPVFGKGNNQNLARATIVDRLLGCLRNDL
jgi:hypothetical protein